MKTKPSAPPPGAVTWRDAVFAVCTQVDWKAIATAALDSKHLGEAFGDSVIVIANVLVAEGRKPKREHPSIPKQARATVEEPRIEAAPTMTDGASHVAAEALPIDPAIADAASLLGVTSEATEKQIRSALRARLSESRAHPDHGGDGDEAKRLIAARDLLLTQVRSQP